jgi:hypothetical protein
MAITQRRIIRDAQGQERDVVWDVDFSVLAATQKWARDTARVERELCAMAEMYPAWTLTLGMGAKPAARDQSTDVAVPTGGTWRWASDGAPLSSIAPQSVLMWEGLLPAPLGGLDRVREKLHGRYPVENIQGSPWTAVPVRVAYSQTFPRAEPDVYYDEKWLSALKFSVGASAHMFAGGRLCLFYPGHWKMRYTAADVLSQRVINHLYSTLKIANGTSAEKAFIGRVHANEWRPER